MMTAIENISIYGADGTLKFTTPTNEGCKRKVELMKEDYITSKFSLTTAIGLHVGDYCDTLPYGQFVLTEPYQPKYNKTTGAYDYDVQLNAHYYLWNNKLFKYRPDNGGQEASFTLTAKIDTFAMLIESNIEALGYKYNGDTSFQVVWDATVTTDMKTITFSNVGVVDAIIQIAETFECEWWIVGYQIHFGRCEEGESVVLEQDVNLVSMESSASKQKYANRLYVFGGTTNVPLRYRKNLVFDVKKVDGYNIEDTSRILSWNLFPTADIGTDGPTYAAAINETKTYTIGTSSHMQQIFFRQGLYEGKYTFRYSGGLSFSTNANATPVTIQWYLAAYNTINGVEQSSMLWESAVIEAFSSTFSMPTEMNVTLPKNVTDVRIGWKITRVHHDSAPYVSYYITFNNFRFSKQGENNSALLELEFVSGNLQGQQFNGTLNIGHTPEGRNTITLQSNRKASLGDRFKVNNIITSLVPVWYFEDDSDSDLTLNGVTENRLMLPEAYGRSYIELADFDADGNLITDYESNTNPRIPESEIVEGLIVSEDTYPKQTFNVTNVISYTGAKDEDKDADLPLTYYLVETDIESWDEKYRIEGSDLEMQFLGGSLAGLKFTVEFRKAGTTITNASPSFTVQNDAFKIVFKEDIQLPNTISMPSIGDEFSLEGWDPSFMGDVGIVGTAEEDLAIVGRDYLRKSATDPNTYTCVPFFDNLKGDNTLDLYLGRKVTLKSDVYFDGGTRESRIIGYEIPLDIPTDNPKYIVGEKAEYSRLGNIEDNIKEIQVNSKTYASAGGGKGGTTVYILKTGDKIAPSESNVYSAKRADNTFLFKDRDDSTEHSLGVGKDLTVGGNINASGALSVGGGTDIKGALSVGENADVSGDINVSGKATVDKAAAFNGGATFGRFASDIITGSGGAVDVNGNAELHSLTVRKFLEVPLLVYNKTDIKVGNVWRSFGGGVIKSVTVGVNHKGETDPNSGKIVLKLEKGEIGTLHFADKCQGIFHDTNGGNDTETTDDGKGNFKFAGFFTSYFVINEVKTEPSEGEGTNNVLYYSLRMKTDNVTPYCKHPAESMTFVAYSNLLDPSRQCSRYSTLTYERYLRNMTGWEIESTNIAAQFGDLSNLSEAFAGDFPEMSGYSVYLNNIYFTGHIEQVEGLDKLLNLYSVDLTEYISDVEVDSEGYIVNGLQDSDGQWRLRSSVTVRNMDNIIVLADDGEEASEGTFTLSVQPYGCEVEVENSTVYVTKIDGLRVEGDASDNFDYDAMRKVTSCYVEILVDCEGRTTISRSLALRVNHTEAPYIGLDLSNEMSSVAWNTKKNGFIGLPVKSEVMMFRNSETMTISKILVKDKDGNIIYSTVSSEVNKTVPGFGASVTFASGKADLEITSLPSNIGNVTTFEVVGFANHAGVDYERSKVLTINRTNDTCVYSLIPSVDQLIKSTQDDGTVKLDVYEVDCSVLCESSDDGSYTMTAQQLADAGLVVKYSLDDDASKTNYTTTVTISASRKKVVFWLMSGDTVVDREEVPVLVEGKDGKDGTDGKDGEDGKDGVDGKDGTTLISSSVQYTVSDNGTVKPSNGWSDTIPSVGKGRYMWTWTHMEYSDGKKMDSYSVSRNGVDGSKGSDGNDGPALRGPQIWEDVPNGYEFQSGGSRMVGGVTVKDPFLDVVLKKSVGKYYRCKVTHNRTAVYDPQYDTEHWEESSKIDFVATSILLAEHAYIENLGATSIIMYDENGAAGGNVVFKAYNGNLICKTGTFENIKVTNAKVTGMLEATGMRYVQATKYPNTEEVPSYTGCPPGSTDADIENYSWYWNKEMMRRSIDGSAIILTSQAEEIYILPDLAVGEMREIQVMTHMYKGYSAKLILRNRHEFNAEVVKNNAESDSSFKINNKTLSEILSTSYEYLENPSEVKFISVKDDGTGYTKYESSTPSWECTVKPNSICKLVGIRAEGETIGDTTYWRFVQGGDNITITTNTFTHEDNRVEYLARWVLNNGAITLDNEITSANENNIYRD